MADLKDKTKEAVGKVRSNCLTWTEFMDFIFTKDMADADKIDISKHWWRKVDGQEEAQPEEIKQDKDETAITNPFETRTGPRYGGYIDQSQKELEITPAMEILQSTR